MVSVVFIVCISVFISTVTDPPMSKKQRLSDGDVDRILNAKSSHDWINEEVLTPTIYSVIPCVCI